VPKNSQRKHLQEWLENYPQALAQDDGEELLIIQKELDGFEPSCVARGFGRERLDLLAIDKGGDLVIIDNKLNDSGRGVVWQTQLPRNSWQFARETLRAGEVGSRD